jgi:hypothetical protein
LEGSRIKSYFDKLKKVILTAQKDNFLDVTQTQFLFDDIKIKVNKPKRIFLEPEEIKRWRTLSFNKEEAGLERDRDLFLFQIYTGYYYNDLEAFKKEQLMRDPEYGAFILGERDKMAMTPLFLFLSFRTRKQSWIDIPLQKMKTMLLAANTSLKCRPITGTLKRSLLRQALRKHFPIKLPGIPMHSYGFGTGQNGRLSPK